MPVDDDTLLAIVAVCLKRKEKRKRKRRHWVTECQKRNEFTYQNLLDELKVSAKNDFRHLLTNDSAVYEELLRMVGPLIKKKDTLMREAIPVGLRLSTTLRFLATGKHFEDMKSSSRMSPNTISMIVLETCEAIVFRLKDYIKLPTQDEWKTVANNFYEKWNFPNCLGVATGKHVAIIKPTGSDTLYYNYKKFFSVVLIGIVNANYEFILADVDISGRFISGCDDFYHTSFGKTIYESSLSMKNDTKPFSERERNLPHVFVGDGAFPLTEQFMKPFSGELTKEQQIYNYHLGRVLQIIENTFGALSSQFGLLQNPISLAPEKVKTIVLACCYLYNFLRRKADRHLWDGVFDKEDLKDGVLIKGSWRQESEMTSLQTSMTKNVCGNAEKKRKQFVQYFNNEGKVPPQLSCDLSSFVLRNGITKTI